MLCQFCGTLDFDAASSSEGASHHASYDALVTSADGGCELCVWLCDQELTCNVSAIHGTIKHLARDGKIRCFYEDDPMGRILFSRPIPTDARSDDTLFRISAWISACTSGHETCFPEVCHRLPKRVVDVGGPDIAPSLFETQGQSGKWVALSYCWGKRPPVKTLLSTLAEFCEELPPLPLIYQDAICVVQRLGYRYLWIDALCIVQDSEDDWLAESADMGRIYKEAALNIVAEAAKDTSTGLFDSTNEEREVPNAFAIRSYSNCNAIKGYLVIGKKRRDKDSSRGPLSDRAWTLQEGALATRNLIFAAGQVWWQCWTMQRNEGVPGPSESISFNGRTCCYNCQWDDTRDLRLTSEPTKTLNANDAKSDFIWDQALEYWIRTVNAYCQRGISYEKDLLPAISGMAKEYHKHINQDYKAGLWSDDMHLELLWSSPVPNSTKIQNYIAPSWSWATLRLPPRAAAGEDRAIYQYSLVGYPLKKRVAKIQSVHITPLHQDIFGQVSSGVLQIEAPCNTMCRCNIQPSFFDCYQDSDWRVNYDELLSYFLADTKMRDTKMCDLAATCTTDRVMEQTCRQDSDIVHKACVLVHIATHKLEDTGASAPNSRPTQFPTFVLALILEAVPAEKNEKYKAAQTPLHTESEENQESKLSKSAYLDGDKTIRAHQLKRKSSLDAQSCAHKVLRKKPLDPSRRHMSAGNSQETIGTKQSYQRIGLAILKETTPTSAIWPTRVVRVI